MKHTILLLFFCVLLAVGSAYAEEAVVQMHLTGIAGAGDNIGTIRASDSPYGTLFTPDLRGLAPGLHGFHVHQNPSCDPQEKDGRMVPGLAADGSRDSKVMFERIQVYLKPGTSNPIDPTDRTHRTSGPFTSAAPTNRPCS